MARTMMFRRYGRTVLATLLLLLTACSSVRHAVRYRTPGFSFKALSADNAVLVGTDEADLHGLDDPFGKAYGSRERMYAEVLDTLRGRLTDVLGTPALPVYPDSYFVHGFRAQRPGTELTDEFTEMLGSLNKEYVVCVRRMELEKENEKVTTGVTGYASAGGMPGAPSYITYAVVTATLELEIWHTRTQRLVHAFTTTDKAQVAFRATGTALKKAVNAAAAGAADYIEADEPDVRAYPEREVERPLTLPDGTWQWRFGILGYFREQTGDGYELYRDYCLYPYPPLPSYAVTDRFEVGFLRTAYAILQGDTAGDGRLRPGDHALALQLALPGLGYGTYGLAGTFTATLADKIVLRKDKWLGFRFQERGGFHGPYVTHVSTDVRCMPGMQLGGRSFIEAGAGVSATVWNEQYREAIDHTVESRIRPVVSCRFGTTLNDRWSTDVFSEMTFPEYSDGGTARLWIEALVVYTR